VQRTYRFRDGKELTIGGRTLVMGILNVTPDSFSDGGKWNTRDRALRHMEEMVREGADIIDVGAESSRPGFVPMGAREEIERLMPFLESVLAECPVPVSVDTFKAETARAALYAGAHLLNDIWGLQYAEEPGEMARAAAEADVPVVVMHNQNGTAYSEDIIASMREFFARSLVLADEAGLARENIILDPGIGFGKTAEQNMHVLRRMDAGSPPIRPAPDRPHLPLRGVLRRIGVGLAPQLGARRPRLAGHRHCAVRDLRSCDQRPGLSARHGMTAGRSGADTRARPPGEPLSGPFVLPHG